MRHLASLPRLAARLLLPAAIAAAAIGGTAAAAVPAQAAPAHGSAPTAPAPAVTFTWHPLTLLNGWESASTSALVTGTPAWALRNGVVYLRGAIKQPAASGNPTFAVLPKAARPSSRLLFGVFSALEVPAVLYVQPNGTMQASSGNADVFTSLAAVSYPAATMKSAKLILEHGWKSAQPKYRTGNPSYAISGGVVHLSGSMMTSGSSPVATLLPKAARPAHEMFVRVYAYAGSTGWLEILPTGQLEAFGPSAGSFTSLAGVSYPARGATWHPFTLEGGWASGATLFGTAAPAYTVIGGVVYLTGSMDQPVGGTGVWTTLPAAARTAADQLEIEVDTSGGNWGAVDITNNLGLVAGVPYSDAAAFTSIDGIAYPQSS